MVKITHKLAKRVNPYIYASKPQWAVLTLENGTVIETDYCTDRKQALAVKKRFDAICK